MQKTSFLKYLLISCFFLTQFVGQTFAQADGEGDILAETKKDMMLVAALGATGAILGLSTLSFVEEPKDHLKNIVVGGAVGIIVGVGVVAWLQAAKSETEYKTVFYEPKSFDTDKRFGWHQKVHNDFNADLNKISSANLQFSF